MRQGYEGIVVAGTMLLVAFALIFGIRLLFG
jgi:hypothetical protein